MKKSKTILTNCVDSAKWNTVKHTAKKNGTTNGTISPAIFKRECAEYDAGMLPFEHELLLGERCV